MGKVYLDNGAGTMPCKSVLENIKDFAELFYNASSINELSKYNKHVIECTRDKIAKLINAEPEEIIFTSCASESNSLAIDGFLKCHDNYSVISSNIEHDSIMNNPNIASFINVNKNGFLNIDDFKYHDLTLFACMIANNEIGSIQPIEEISKVIHDGCDNYLFVDATAAFGHMDIDVKKMGIDMMSATAQKIGGINGCAFLYVKNGIELKPIIYGHQEEGIRGGTYNQLAIKCFGLALDTINKKKQIAMKAKRNYLIDGLLDINGVHLNGTVANRLCNNVNIRIDNLGIDNQQLVTILDGMGYVVSPSSACNSGEENPSHVLKAIGLTDEQANHSIRITLSDEVSVQELDGFVDALRSVIFMNKIDQEIYQR